MEQSVTRLFWILLQQTIPSMVPSLTLNTQQTHLRMIMNGLDIVLDLPGNGVGDVCARKIRIPSDDGSLSSWDAWNDEEKLYRYWKLRVKEFTAIDNSTSNYIISETREIIELDNPKGVSMKKFYCDKAFGTKMFSEGKNTCTACTVDNSLKYKAKLKEDLGEGFVQELALPTCSAPASSGVTVSATLLSLSALLVHF